MKNDEIISLKNVNVKMGDRFIINNVSLSINRNEFVYITGETGSGKSTLLKLLYAEYPLFSGAANILDYNLATINYKQIPFLRRKIGIVFQDFSLLMDRSAYQNLAFVLKATGWKDENKIKTAIEKQLYDVGIEECIHKMPFQMSGGEQQRLGIARALINDPEIIFADEPTGNLDPETSEAVLELLIDINRSGKTVLMSTHDILIISKFHSREIRFHFGEIVDDIIPGPEEEEIDNENPNIVRTQKKQRLNQNEYEDNNFIEENESENVFNSTQQNNNESSKLSLKEKLEKAIRDKKNLNANRNNDENLQTPFNKKIENENSANIKYNETKDDYDDTDWEDFQDLVDKK